MRFLGGYFMDDPAHINVSKKFKHKNYGNIKDRIFFYAKSNTYICLESMALIVKFIFAGCLIALLK